MIMGSGPAARWRWPCSSPRSLSLALFVTTASGPAVLVLDAAIGLVALADLATLIGSGRFHAERRCGACRIAGRAAGG